MNKKIKILIFLQFKIIKIKLFIKFIKKNKIQKFLNFEYNPKIIYFFITK
jgi:hypothetical protein